MVHSTNYKKGYLMFSNNQKDKIELIMVNGYYQQKSKPSFKKLQEYYSKKYYQEATGSYEHKYSKNEIKYFKNRLRFIESCIKKIDKKILNKASVIDVGCGEGWALSHFKNLGCDITGVDFSDYGVLKFNPDIANYFIKMNIYDFIQEAIRKKFSYDIIILQNVIEHVLNPESLLDDLMKIMKKNSILIITFPNDFSHMQNFLIKENKINKDSFIFFEHISYFNGNNFKNLINRIGYKLELVLADFPIDLFLMDDYSNYVIDGTKGKQAHYSRINFMNLIAEINYKKALEIFLNFGSIGIGRNLTVFCTLM